MTTPIITARALLDAYWDLQIPIDLKPSPPSLGCGSSRLQPWA